MEEIINILCKRDGYTKSEAKQVVEETMSEVTMCIENGDFDLAEEIFTSDLGLEIDYLIDILI